MRGRILWPAQQPLRSDDIKVRVAVATYNRHGLRAARIATAVTGSPEIGVKAATLAVKDLLAQRKTPPTTDIAEHIYFRAVLRRCEGTGNAPIRIPTNTEPGTKGAAAVAFNLLRFSQRIVVAHTALGGEGDARIAELTGWPLHRVSGITEKAHESLRLEAGLNSLRDVALRDALLEATANVTLRTMSWEQGVQLAGDVQLSRTLNKLVVGAVVVAVVGAAAIGAGNSFTLPALPSFTTTPRAVDADPYPHVSALKNDLQTATLPAGHHTADVTPLVHTDLTLTLEQYEQTRQAVAAKLAECEHPGGTKPADAVAAGFADHRILSPLPARLLAPEGHPLAGLPIAAHVLPTPHDESATPHGIADEADELGSGVCLRWAQAQVMGSWENREQLLKGLTTSRTALRDAAYSSPELMSVNRACIAAALGETTTVMNAPDAGPKSPDIDVNAGPKDPAVVQLGEGACDNPTRAHMEILELLEPSLAPHHDLLSQARAARDAMLAPKETTTG